MKNLEVYKNDLPKAFISELGGAAVAVDTETMGLNPHRDRLCLAQFSKGDGTAAVVQFFAFNSCPNIKELLSNPGILKIFHFARFDVTVLYQYIGVMTQNVYCTKIASKLARTYTDHHSLKDLCSELLGVNIAKTETCTDWGKPELSQEQLKYAAEDVLFLHKIRDKLNIMLQREGRDGLAQRCFDFLSTRAILDLTAGNSFDIFAH